MFRLSDFLHDVRGGLHDILTGPPVLAFFPALVLGGFWLGGEDMLIMIALGFPVCLAFAGVLRSTPRRSRRSGDDDQTFGRVLRDTVRIAAQSARRTGCILVEIDDHAALVEQHGQAAMDDLVSDTAARLRTALRSRDQVTVLSENLIGISLGPVRHLDLGNVVALAGRLQATAEEPLPLGGTKLAVTVSAGVAMDTNLRRKSGEELLDAASLALAEARLHAPASLRVYSQEMRGLGMVPAALSEELCAALENGEIQAWFQPQVSTDTGHVTGAEALARWCHPVRGMIPPSEFLSTLEAAGQMEKLGDTIFRQALTALRKWDVAGLGVPRIGVNFSPEELRNPRLADKIRWELDQFDIAPSRICIEILETVIAASPDDTVVRNINALSAMGCHIDLDDFGTGHASISSIRRFPVGRLKIDRSFVMKVDRDTEQQRMVSAILLMAERLELDTLAEGVETPGEHAMLAQLGCAHVQGFGIARPMPADQCADWVAAHRKTVEDPPAIRRRTI